MGAYVLYYHRIFPKDPAPDVTLSLFDWEMAYLKRHYQIVSLNSLIDYINGELVLDRPGVAITFDDGWFDNFVYAWPVLKKYGLKATIFVSTGKIRAAKSVRSTMEDCWDGRISLDDLQKPKEVEEGFLDSLSGDFGEFINWEELRVMQKSGVFDIQSHGVEHKKVFSSDTAEGLVSGKVGWSVISASSAVREGMPLYPTRSALASRRYYPAEADLPGRWESEEEMGKRILKELTESKEAIDSQIGVAPVHLCWPWGQYSEAGIEMAKKAGYLACYTTKPGTIKNGTDRYRIPRVSTKRGRLTFVKRGRVYTNPFISKAYCLLTNRGDTIEWH